MLLQLPEVVVTPTYSDKVLAAEGLWLVTSKVLI
jgi:hypothetical protein